MLHGFYYCRAVTSFGTLRRTRFVCRHCSVICIGTGCVGHIVHRHSYTSTFWSTWRRIHRAVAVVLHRKGTGRPLIRCQCGWDHSWNSSVQPALAEICKLALRLCRLCLLWLNRTHNDGNLNRPIVTDQPTCHACGVAYDGMLGSTGLICISRERA